MRRGCAWRSLPPRGRAPCAPRGAFVTPHMLPAQLGRARGCRESSPRGRPVPALALLTQASHVTSVPSFPHEQDGAVSPSEDVTRTRGPACRAASCLPSGAALLMPYPPPAPRPGCPFVCALSCATPGLHRRCDTLVPAAARPVPSLSAPHAHPGGSCTLFFSSNFRNSVSGSERAAACPVLGCTSRR